MTNNRRTRKKSLRVKLEQIFKENPSYHFSAAQLNEIVGDKHPRTSVSTTLSRLMSPDKYFDEEPDQLNIINHSERGAFSYGLRCAKQPYPNYADLPTIDEV
jgi:hypothetical protein